MSPRRWIVLAAIVVVLVGIATAARPRDGGAPDAQLDATAGADGLVSARPSVAAATPRASATPEGPSPTPETTPAPIPTATALPTRTATTPPRASGDPRLAYAAFVLRVTDDRAAVEGLNGALLRATDDQDLPAVRGAAVDILDFVDRERDWLREHPPADCYADTHAAANAMLEAYGTAADRFVAWTAAGGGLAGLGAFGLAIDAASAASDALTAFGRALEATTCQA